MTAGHATLDEALRASFPAGVTSLVAVREHEPHAVALFNTHPGGEPYLYQVHYYLHDGRWAESGSSNGEGWSCYESASGLGVSTVWGDDAPAGSDRVRAALDGSIREEAVQGSQYLVAFWDVPDSLLAQVQAFRVGDEWVQAPTMREKFQALRERLGNQ